MQITPTMIKDLREKTGAGIMDCKEALTAADGAMEEAIDFLRKKGLQAAAKRAARSTQEGVVGSYIHGGGRLGVLVEVNCETDFVARTDDFQELVHDLAMQVAASNPLYLAREDIPDETVTKERHIYEEQARASGRPAPGPAQNCRRAPGKIFPGGVLARSVFCQRSEPDGAGCDQGKDCQDG